MHCSKLPLFLVSIVAANHVLLDSPRTTQAPAIQPRRPDFDPLDAFTSLTSALASGADSIDNDVQTMYSSITSDFASRWSSLQSQMATATGPAVSALVADLSSLQSSYVSATAALTTSTGTSTRSAAAGSIHNAAIGFGFLVGGMAVVVNLY